MKKQFLLLGTAAIFAFAACNDNGTSTTTNKDTTVATAPGDSSVTTTTTTTTRTAYPISNFEHRTFYSVKTHKPVKLRMDTVLHYYVDVSTNQQPDYYYYDPSTKDTFDYWGRRLNNALILNNGDYTIDESRLSSEYTTPPTTTTPTTTTTVDTSANNPGKMKMKAKDDKTKVKTKDNK
jgi:hypothetical protein